MASFAAYASVLPKQFAAVFGTSRASARPELQVFSSSGETMVDAPQETFASIRVLGGQPIMRALELAATPDGKLASGVWDCSAGTIEVRYFFDEVIHILEGEVHIEVNGQKRTLRAGDVAMFPMGLYTVWQVPEYVRKIWIMRHPQRSIAERALGKIRRTLERAKQ